MNTPEWNWCDSGSTRAADEPFTLSPEDEDELVAAMSEIERGEYVTLDELLRDLPQ